MKRPRLTWLRQILLGLGLIVADRAMADALVEVDGTASRCVVNVRGMRQQPGDAVLFPAPKFGYCAGTIQKDCATNVQPYGPQSSAYSKVTRTCVGTFTSVEERQASALSILEKRVNEQTAILQANNRALSNAVDALTRRIQDLEDKANVVPQ